jgi:hypothetical protein
MEGAELGVKRYEHEADYSASPIAMVRNVHSYTYYIDQYNIYAVVLV